MGAMPLGVNQPHLRRSAPAADDYLTGELRTR
jgi:hypothetical protein